MVDDVTSPSEVVPSPTSLPPDAAVVDVDSDGSEIVVDDPGSPSWFTPPVVSLPPDTAVVDEGAEVGGADPSLPPQAATATRTTVRTRRAPIKTGTLAPEPRPRRASADQGVGPEVQAEGDHRFGAMLNGAGADLPSWNR
jgi:hypothetical protein